MRFVILIAAAALLSSCSSVREYLAERDKVKQYRGLQDILVYQEQLP